MSELSALARIVRDWAAHHYDTLVRDTAAKLVHYKDQAERGEITVAEYEILCKHLLDPRRVNDAAKSEMHKHNLALAFDALRNFSKLEFN